MQRDHHGSGTGAESLGENTASTATDEASRVSGGVSEELAPGAAIVHVARLVPGVGEGGASPAPAPAAGVSTNGMRASVWWPVLWRAGAAVAGLSLLTFAGAWSMTKGAERDAPVELDTWVREPADSPREGGSRDELDITSAPPDLTSTALAAPASAAVAQSAGTGTAKAPPCEAEVKAPPALTDDGRIILNEAGVDELTRLPGVGEKRAAAILELRERLGRFRRVTDLLRVRGIGVKSLRKWTDRVVLDRPPAPPSVATESSGEQKPATPADAGKGERTPGKDAGAGPEASRPEVSRSEASRSGVAPQSSRGSGSASS